MEGTSRDLCVPRQLLDLVHPVAVMVAELAVLDPIEIRLLVLIPQELQSNGFLAFELAVDPLSLGHSLGLVCVARTEQMLHIDPSHSIRDRPAEPDAVGSPDHIADSAVGNLQAFGNPATAQLHLVIESYISLLLRTGRHGLEYARDALGSKG